jgi:hydroxypyruvate isomerase
MTHTLRYDANCSILFTEHPLLDRPRAARDAGFSAVEFWWPFPTATPDKDEVDAFVSAISDAGVALAGLNFFAGDLKAGDRGILSWPGREDEFAAGVRTALDIGQRVGCRAYNALYGRMRGGRPAETQSATADRNLQFACSEAARRDAVVLLEPVSGFDDYPLRTAGDVAAVIERHDAPNLRMLLDLYHLATNGDDLAQAVDTYAELVGHVQIADAPGRGEPGSGDLPLDALLGRLQDHGYDGRVGLEYSPTTDTEQSLGWLPRDRRSEHPQPTKEDHA